MNRINAHFLCFVVAITLVATNVSAQPPDLPKFPALPTIPDFQTKLSSATDWEQIPTGRKLAYAFNSTRFLYLNKSPDDLGLTGDDYDLINLAANGTPPQERSLAEYTLACEFYESRTSQGLPVNTSYLARVFANSQQYDDQDKYSFLEEIFNQMSLEGKQLLLDTIEAARGTKNIGMSRINWIAVAARDPARLRSAFVRGCENLSSRIARYEHNRANPGAGTLLMPITGQEINHEDQ